jgi:hypothetical protein
MLFGMRRRSRLEVMAVERNMWGKEGTVREEE